MKIAYFDCFAGAAGDMIAAALIHAGADISVIKSRLAKLSLTGYEVQCNEQTVQGILSMRFNVNIDGSEKPHRHLHHITEMIQAASLGKSVETMAVDIFTNLARAEAQVHNTTIEKIHFHEVGAVDSIVDIVTAAIALDELGVEEVFCSPIPLGSGVIKCDHGIMPVPAPATARLLADAHAATVPGPNPGEATTPTAAAILTTLCKNVGVLPEMSVISTGYGAGGRQDGPAPNLLRAIIGQTAAPGEGNGDCVMEMSANIDDTSGEVIGLAIDQLMQAGALDAWATPVYTKKNRPAWTLGVLCRLADEKTVEEAFFRHAGTFGLRKRTVNRSKLKVDFQTVETVYGPIRIKTGSLDGRALAVKVEFEDAALAARSHNASVTQVMDAAKAKFLLDNRKTQ